MNIHYINDRLKLTATGLVWVKGAWTKGKEAGDAKGRVSLEGEKYTKDSVVAALSAQDIALLVPAKAAPKSPPKVAPKAAKELRELLATVSNKQDLLAVYRTIELLEAAC